MEESQKLQERWLANPEMAISSSRAHYKIDRSMFLGRGGFGIVYGAIMRTSKESKQGQNNQKKQYSYEQVVIKEFKKSQKWKTEDDWDRQLVVLKKFHDQWDWNYILQVKDIFQFQNRKFYLVTKYAQGGTLCSIIKTRQYQQTIIQFVTRSAQILHYLHYDVLRGFRTREKGEEQKQALGIIHRDFKPDNLVFANAKVDMKEMYLIDFGVAKIGYTNYPKPYSNCGTNNYKAPEIADVKIFNAKVDIYSFGCTLYELLSNGQRLLGTKGLGLSGVQKEQYIKNKLVDMENKMLRMFSKNSKYKDNQERKWKYPLMWVEILSRCLQMDPKVRWSSKDLLDYIVKYKQSGYPAELEKGKYYFTKISTQAREFRQFRDQFDINFQLYRLNTCQNIVFQMFQYYYFEQPRLSKFVLYVCLKYIAIFLLEKYEKTKAKAKAFDKVDKYNLLKRQFEEKKIVQIRDKSHQKIRTELSKEIDCKGKNTEKGPIQEITDKHPQLLLEKTHETRRTLFQFCHKKSQEILMHQKFAKMLGVLVLMTDELDAYPDNDISEHEKKGNYLEALSLKKLYQFKKFQEDKIERQGLSQLYQALRVESTVRTQMNREEVKTDIPVELKK